MKIITFRFTYHWSLFLKVQLIISQHWFSWWHGTIISMGWCKKDVTPLLTHWSYVFLAQTHRSYPMTTLFTDASVLCVAMMIQVLILNDDCMSQQKKYLLNSHLIWSLWDWCLCLFVSYLLGGWSCWRLGEWVSPLAGLSCISYHWNRTALAVVFCSSKH